MSFFDQDLGRLLVARSVRPDPAGWGELNAEAERQTDRDTTEGFPTPIGARGADAADRKP